MYPIIRKTQPLKRSLIHLIVLISVCVAMAGCGQPTIREEVSQTEQSGNSMQAAIVHTPTMTLPERQATKEARFAEERRLVAANSTKFALGTPYPTTRPYVAPTPEPVPTLATRIHGECADGNSEFLYTGCWTGRLGNDYLFVESGAPLSDLSQGTIRIYTGTLDLLDFGLRQSYSTPIEAGIIRITDVTWPHMTLITMDSDPPVTFGFDLSTRQWVPSPPLSTPSLSVPPLPTLSPDLSPIPSVPPLP
jgi:hypothetical protein